MTQRITVAGYPAELRKVASYVDTGDSQFVSLIPWSYDYGLTVYGDAGDEFDLAVDDKLIHWKRVAFDSRGKSEYVAVGEQDEENQ